jgi:enoyl-[acyl-carrier protein] reductase I
MSTSLSLEGKRGIVLGIANRHSIAYGIAEVLSEQSAELCITYLNEKSKLFVAPLPEKLTNKLFLPCDMSKLDELESVFAETKNQWGAIDISYHLFIH